MILKVSRATKVAGDIYISGSKNAVLPCVCAALLTKQTVKITNVPDIEDVNNLLTIIKNLGVKVKREKEEVTIQAKHLKPVVFDNLVESLRGSYYLIGSILGRYSKLRIKYPGGCNLGDRPIDYHLYVLKELGFKVTDKIEYLDIVEMQRKNAIITFPKISLGATINTLLLASKIQGETIITNPSLEPEVLSVIDMLRKMGSIIEKVDGQLRINGVSELSGVTHQNIYDRIEAGSYLFLAGAIRGSSVRIHNVDYHSLENVISTSRIMGIEINKIPGGLEVKGPEKIKNINLLIGEYPFFPTDLQQIITVVLLKSKKTSRIEDPIFPKRNAHLLELRKMGAYVYTYDNVIYIMNSVLSSSKVKATDLRCAFALIIAGALGNRTTYIYNIEYLFRGYVEPLKKLKSIGINVELI